jgi:hypothetical protein
MKKTILNILIILGALLFLLAIVVIGMGPKVFYYKLLYYGDRMDIKITMNIDGIVTIPDIYDIRVSKIAGDALIETEKDAVHISFEGKRAKDFLVNFKIGNYDYWFTIPHRSWWDVVHDEIEVNVDTNNKVYSYTVTRTNLNDNGEEQTNSRIMSDIDLEEQNLLYSIN